MGNLEALEFDDEAEREPSWFERHANVIGVALLVVPLMIRSVLASAGASDDAADLSQLVVGGVSLVLFTFVIVVSRRRRSGAS
jgi:hypothetical protein